MKICEKCLMPTVVCECSNKYCKCGKLALVAGYCLDCIKKAPKEIRELFKDEIEWWSGIKENK